MRHLPARPLAGSVLCATLALGAAAPAAADPSGDGGPPGGSYPAAPSDGEVSGRPSAVKDAVAVLTPVSGLLDAVIAADGNRISPSAARGHARAVRAAIAVVRARTTARAVRAGWAGPGTAGSGKVAPGTAGYGTAGRGASPAGAGPVGAGLAGGGLEGGVAAGRTASSDAAPGARLRVLARLRSAADSLARASAAGDRAGVNRYGALLVRESVAYAAAALLADGLPAPDLQGHPRTVPNGRTATTP